MSRAKRKAQKRANTIKAKNLVDEVNKAVSKKEYKYVCPICGLVQTYTKQGIYHCPDHDVVMSPQ